MDDRRLHRIYLDQINGTPLLPQASEAMKEAWGKGGNPSSPHAEGRAANGLKERARVGVASLVRARGEEITFTSSGTEANAWALTGLTKAGTRKGNHLVVSAVEHPSILQTARRMEKEGWKVTAVPVDRAGRVDPAAVEAALTPETALVSIQWANSEVGTLQPVGELARRVKARGILFHTDAVAAAGQLPIDLKAVPADALSLAANTFGGPPGAGALFVRKGVRILPLFVGGAQEDGRRAGTENLAGIVGMGEAARVMARELPGRIPGWIGLRDRLSRGIESRLPEARLNGHPTERLPGHLSVSLPGADAEALVLALDREGISVGIGSACTARAMKASHVLRAMGADDAHALGTITLTLGVETTEEEIDRVLEILPRVAAGQIKGGLTPAGSSRDSR
ncbi:MAG: cysteine desulfurase [Candidatus Omnitrophica bacterium]|nr:cysteine desulfurase [Candidatus Omnitrophota bacterium]